MNKLRKLYTLILKHREKITMVSAVSTWVFFALNWRNEYFWGNYGDAAGWGCVFGLIVLLVLGCILDFLNKKHEGK